MSSGWSLLKDQAKSHFLPTAISEKAIQRKTGKDIICAVIKAIS